MNLQVQPLKVLATRQVVRNRLDFTSYLNGTVRDELVRLDRLEGQFRIQASKLTIEAICNGKTLLTSDDWVDFKECLENKLSRSIVNFIEGKEEFSIVERKEGLRTWIISDVDNKKRDLLQHYTENPQQISGIWYDNDNFIQDGRLVSIDKGYQMYNGKMISVLDFQEYITADNEGNIRRRKRWHIPNFNLFWPQHIIRRLLKSGEEPVHNLDIKITKEMLAFRVLDNAPSELPKLSFTRNCKSYLNACAEFPIYLIQTLAIAFPIVVFSFIFLSCYYESVSPLSRPPFIHFLVLILRDLSFYLAVSTIGLVYLAALLGEISSKL